MRASAHLCLRRWPRRVAPSLLGLLVAWPLLVLADEPPAAATSGEPASATSSEPASATSGELAAETPDAAPAEAAGEAAPAATPNSEAASSQDQGPARFETQIAFDAEVAAKQYGEAATTGERLVELTASEFGDKSLELATVLTKLGDVQREDGDHDAAEQTFMRAINIVRETDGQFSTHLIAPMVGLGNNYEAAGDHLNALSTFSEARALNRRAFGILNPDQVPIMDLMSDTLYKMDRMSDAEDLQVEALEMAERTYGQDTIGTLDAIYKYARWLHRFNRVGDELDQYQHAIKIIEDAEGDTSLRLVTPLRAIGNSLREQRIEDGHGIGSLRHALDIIKSQPDPDPLELAKTLRDIGDWRTAFTRVGVDGDEYVQAWELLGQVENGEALRHEWFTGVEYVLFEPLPSRRISRDADALEGHVLVKFDLDESGRPDNIEVVQSDPPGLKDDAALRSLRQSRFRPNMKDGKIVATHGLAVNFRYPYIPEDEGK